MPDVHPKTPLIPATLEWESGERVVLKDEEGMPKMVPAYDPMLEDFVERHEHELPDKAVTHGDQIQVIAVDQKTWDTMDMVTQVKTELQRQTGEVYAENDEHRQDALKCYNAHGNPDISTGCRDYKSDSKLIGKWNYDDGEGHHFTIPPDYRQYLCYMCPFQQTAIAVELRRRKGMYSDEKIYKERARARKGLR